MLILGLCAIGDSTLIKFIFQSFQCTEICVLHQQDAPCVNMVKDIIAGAPLNMLFLRRGARGVFFVTRFFNYVT